MADSENDKPPAPALKEMFDEKQFRKMAKIVGAIDSSFDGKAFLRLALKDLDGLTLMQRLRRMTECLHATLPKNYRKALGILRKVAPRIERSFVTLVLPDFVSLYGQDDFEVSMDALKFFTTFGSSEFAVREFLRRDLKRTLAVMEEWSQDPDEAVRRLASEGCRPRLPWSFQLTALVADPNPAAPILESLREDSSLYVKKSVANHLNDVAKDHPEWVLKRLQSWPLENPHTAWIAKRALRTLIKKGDRAALALLGAHHEPELAIRHLRLDPAEVKLGDRLTLSFELQSKAETSQRLVVDYVVHYVKKLGGTSAKVFKLKELTLGAGERVTLARTQSIRDFTTRVHYAGRHAVEIMVNGMRLAKGEFRLLK